MRCDREPPPGVTLSRHVWQYDVDSAVWNPVPGATALETTSGWGFPGPRRVRIFFAALFAEVKSRTLRYGKILSVYLYCICIVLLRCSPVGGMYSASSQHARCRLSLTLTDHQALRRHHGHSKPNPDVLGLDHTVRCKHKRTGDGQR